MFCRGKSCLVTCLGKLFSGQDGGILLYTYYCLSTYIKTGGGACKDVSVDDIKVKPQIKTQFYLLLQLSFQSHWVATAAARASVHALRSVFGVQLLSVVHYCHAHAAFEIIFTLILKTLTAPPPHPPPVVLTFPLPQTKEGVTSHSLARSRGGISWRCFTGQMQMVALCQK